ncbi:AP-1 complex subunit gamma-1 [Wickerhamomyces ciferrii]|uniref:AP-1 complex subunit gamma n=1 Tax=Wickerhamomyces ciferrii (strain ATCC 14091 / BCRC 22168 / CBS 111 / JCM 3599 / NBRC 0793 / NRRL Y-1031 F-60-10) TaxID=1206466 RepID=K0KME5_WICCF|nr:AP-1 complex subunit gamma-1 [Wickerhamomyces ciferrii]CCH43372.1 AP-1 complex subunit gamma-1 [Wickerhamomyces ciferrii]
MTTSLRSFIKSVRASKTIADERSIIKRESALIRTSFKDTAITHQVRRVNIQKLLYLYILGEKTHFGQIECIKLLASPNFIDKRLGYLATMLILDENQEVLTLLTNSLNNDLNHPNQFIVSLALATFGNIASPELARDLYTDVEKVISCNNNYLKKKAAIVASKIVEKEPDLSEIFISQVDQLLNSHDHGVLIGATKLIRSLYTVSPEFRQELISKIPKIIELLKSLLSSNLNQDYDLVNIHDPFLQIALIRTLRTFFTDDEQYQSTSKYNEQLNDILTIVVSNNDFSKNAGGSVIHEAVKTIFSIQNLDPALKVLGINTLGELLSAKKENNNRYIALNTLLSVVEIEPLAVQRHRSTIVACLSDLDISIKRRALELSFAILDNSNIRILIKEILNFLEDPINNDKDLKLYITTNIVNILERSELIPNEKWKFDTLARLVKSNGDFITQSISSQILGLIINIPNSDELKTYTVNKLFKLGYEDYNQNGLNLIVSWLVGEYGDLLLKSKLQDETAITDDMLSDYLISLANLQNDNNTLISYILTSSLKLSGRISSSSSKNKLKNFIESKTKSVDLGIQIKAVSYSVIFNEPDHIKKGLLDKMPPPPIKVKDTITLTNRISKPLTTGTSINSTHSNNGKTSKTEDLLLDLMDDEPIPNQKSSNEVDLLNDIFNNNGPQATGGKSSSNDILGLFDSPAQLQQQQPNKSTSLGIEALKTDKVKVSFTLKQVESGSALIETQISNLTSSKISNLQLLIAVPKTQKLTMSSISNPIIDEFGIVTQDLKIVGSKSSKIKLRVKFEFDINGVKQTEQFDFGKFKETL